jgi:hypothetical protein
LIYTGAVLSHFGKFFGAHFAQLGNSIIDKRAEEHCDREEQCSNHIRNNG